MLRKLEAKQLIDDVFEEEALVLGGMVAVHEIEDDLVWKLVKNLDLIRRKYIRRLEEQASDEVNRGSAKPSALRPHPAIEEFLLSMRKA